MKRTPYVTIALGLVVLTLSSAWLGASLALRWNGENPPDPASAGPPFAMIERPNGCNAFRASPKTNADA